MSGVGEMLRSGRESAGLGREEMARILRVQLSTVDALEEERWADLPRPVYLRGFVGAWCRAAGMDEGAARDALAGALGAAASEVPRLPGAPADTGIRIGARPLRRKSGRLRVPAILAAAAVLLAGFLYMAWPSGSLRHRAPPASPASITGVPQWGTCAPDSGTSRHAEEVFGE